jgi:hypothetical protein
MNRQEVKIKYPMADNPYTIPILFKMYSEYFNSRPVTAIKNIRLWDIEYYNFRIFPFLQLRQNMNLAKLRSSLMVQQEQIFLLNYFQIKYSDINFYRLFLPAKYKDNKVIGYDLSDVPMKKYKNIILILNVEVSISDFRSGHAMIVFYNHETCVAELYDPNGSGSPYYDFEILKQSIIDIFTMNYIKVKKFEEISVTCHVQGLQMIQGRRKHLEDQENTLDLEGYCLYWGYLMIELRLNNPGKTIADLEIKLYHAVSGYLNKYIREYYLYLQNLIYKVLRFAMQLNSKLHFNDYLYNLQLLECIWYHKKCSRNLLEMYYYPEKYLSKFCNIPRRMTNNGFTYFYCSLNFQNQQPTLEGLKSKECYFFLYNMFDYLNCFYDLKDRLIYCLPN